MPEYERVNWDDAACAGYETEVFYWMEEAPTFEEATLLSKLPRKVCGICPIRTDCLTYAFGYEQYGMWGGLTSHERRAVHNPARYARHLQKAKEEFSKLQISWSEVRKAYERSRHELRLAGQTVHRRQDGTSRNC